MEKSRAKDFNGKNQLQLAKNAYSSRDRGKSMDYPIVGSEVVQADQSENCGLNNPNDATNGNPPLG